VKFHCTGFPVSFPWCEGSSWWHL